MQVNMNKLQIGTKREEKTHADNGLESIFYIIGVAALCFTLVFQINDAPEKSMDDCVPAMSSAVQEREELISPEKPASSVTEQSFFDELGELFAELIFGKNE